MAGRNATPRSRPRRRVAAIAAALVVVAGGTSLALAVAGVGSRGSGGNGSASGASGNPKSPIVDLADRPAFSQIVYQVADYSSGTAVTSWEVLTDRRPFEESDLTYSANPLLGAAPVKGSESTFGSVYSLSGTKLERLSDAVPSVGESDQALGVELPDLVDRGLAQAATQTMTVAGRSCRVFRFSGPPNGPVAPLTGTDHDDLCLDDSGLVLSESWTYGGSLAVQRTAVAVAVTSADPEIDSGPPLSKAVAGPGPAVITLTAGTSTASAFLRSPGDPVGYSAFAPQAVVVADPARPSTAVDRSTVWSFAEGGDLVTVEAGEGQLPWQNGDTPPDPVLLTGLGAATSALTSDGPEIRIQLSGDRWVRVDGTIPLAQLIGYAATLQKTT